MEEQEFVEVKFNMKLADKFAVWESDNFMITVQSYNNIEFEIYKMNLDYSDSMMLHIFEPENERELNLIIMSNFVMCSHDHYFSTSIH